MRLSLVELDLSHNELTAAGGSARAASSNASSSITTVSPCCPLPALVASSEGLRELLLNHNEIATINGKVAVECRDFSLAHNPLSSAAALKKLAAQQSTSRPAASRRCRHLRAMRGASRCLEPACRDRVARSPPAARRSPCSTSRRTSSSHCRSKSDRALACSSSPSATIV